MTGPVASLAVGQAVLAAGSSPLTGLERFLLMLPLCLSIAVVYKTTRCDRLRDVPRASLGLWLTIVLGMYAVGIGLWAVFEVAV
ncbi:MAG: hypothetical protein ACE5EX_02675 [Phycisphaerae bacterium]